MRLSRPTLLGFVCIASFAAVGAALVSQYQFGMLPCPWCILQRFIFVVIGVVAGLAWVFPPVAAKRALAAVGVALAGCGVAAALYQHFVAAKSDSCALTFADKVVGALQLESISPYLFSIQASCADAAVSLLGVPYEAWSGMLFVVLGTACALVMRRS